ncbi:MAG: exosortase C-terminal domain/associated protein EpsI, partial [Sphingobium sp.]
DAAVGFDHVMYGWVFFAIIMTIVMAAAWPFFDRKPGDPWFDPRRLQPVAPRGRPTGLIAGGALAMVVAAPLWLAGTAAAGDALPAALDLPVVEGWARVDDLSTHPWKPRFDGADHLVMGRYRNPAGQIVDLAIATYDRQEDERELVGFGQGAADPDSDWTWSAPAPAPHGARGEQITAPGPVIRHVVTFYGVGGAPLTGNKPEVKMQTMKARLLGGDQRAVAILISAENRDDRPAGAAIDAFLRDLGRVQDLADRSAGIG